jgi:hypothetical protein
VNTQFRWGKLRGRRHIEDLGVDGRTIIKRMFKKWGRGMDWVDLAQDTDRWFWALANAAINMWVA